MINQRRIETLSRRSKGQSKDFIATTKLSIINNPQVFKLEVSYIAILLAYKESH